MIRVVLFLLVIAALAIGAAWFADRPGAVTIEWLGQHIEISFALLALAVGALMGLAIFLWWIAFALLRAPASLRQRLQVRAARRGYLALSQGLIAVGSGDARAARRFADEANRFAPGEPLTLLLGAQSAQLAGDRAAAEKSFKAMALRPDTRLFGLHGLFVEARRRHDAPTARLIAEEAARGAAAPAWAGSAVLEFRCAAGDWTGALERLEANQKSGFVDKDTYSRQRAVLLTARALAVETTDRAGAKALALGAVRLAPTLVPAAALAGRLLGEAGELRQAARILETAWSANPHPDLADAYAHLRPGDSAREGLSRVQTLVLKSPTLTGASKVEAALAVGQAALDAREFAIARAALASLAASPTQRAAVLFARLEELEHGDEGKAREWMARALRARRDPVWTADGFVSDRWLPVSPVTGKLDAFVWTEPLAQVGSAGEDASAADIIEAPPRAADQAAIAAPAAAAPAVVVLAAASDSAPSAVPAAVAIQTAPALTDAVAKFEGTKPEAGKPEEIKGGAGKPEVVNPLVHAPDDPGPGGEPQTEPAAAAAPPPANGWDRLRALFR
jgi:HemY protein